VRTGAVSDRDACFPPVGEVCTGILRHAGALDRAICPQSEDTAGSGKEFPAGNMRVTATARDDDTRRADIGNVLGIDITSGDTGRAQV
jgi:hypothetical protein